MVISVLPYHLSPETLLELHLTLQKERIVCRFAGGGIMARDGFNGCLERVQEMLENSLIRKIVTEENERKRVNLSVA